MLPCAGLRHFPPGSRCHKQVSNEKEEKTNQNKDLKRQGEPFSDSRAKNIALSDLNVVKKRSFYVPKSSPVRVILHELDALAVFTDMHREV